MTKSRRARPVLHKRSGYCNQFQPEKFGRPYHRRGGGSDLSAFLPVKIRFTNLQAATAIQSVVEARAAMDAAAWKNKHLHSYRQALRLLEEAQAGTCRQSIAFAAFVKAARDQDMIVSDQPSEALKRLDVLARSIHAQDRMPRSI
ncbi:DUF982 domain-containing protein [Mesorhizobium sp. B2-5-9]|nr:DUF982 domain-containing protein [Mesorhizobium sp. B2-5-9]